MDYVDVRKKFAELSGRWDLLTATYEDAGADFFLNAGQKYLDHLLDAGKMIGRYPVIVTAGAYVVKTIGLRAIKEVWAANAGGKFQLLPDILQKIKTEYSEDLSSIHQGVPRYYAPAIFRPFPDTLASTVGMHSVGDLLLFSASAPAQHFNYDGIVIMPPSDGTYTIEIVGLFYSPTLSATLSGSVWTQAKSFWTEVHPDILLSAAIYKLHALYHNTSAAADYKVLVLEDILGLDKDIVERDLVGYLQMGG